MDGEELYLGFEEAGQPSRARNGCVLGHLFTDGDYVNEEMIREGSSGYWTKYGPGRFPNTLRSAEMEARLEGRGLWSQ